MTYSFSFRASSAAVARAGLDPNFEAANPLQSPVEARDHEYALAAARAAIDLAGDPPEGSVLVVQMSGSVVRSETGSVEAVSSAVTVYKSPV